MPILNQDTIDFTEKTFVNKYTNWCYENIIRAIQRGSVLEKAVLAAGKFGYMKLFNVVYFEPSYDKSKVEYYAELIGSGQHCLLRCEVQLSDYILGVGKVFRPNMQFFYVDIDDEIEKFKKENFIKLLENSSKIALMPFNNS